MLSVATSAPNGAADPPKQTAALTCAPISRTGRQNGLFPPPSPRLLITCVRLLIVD